MNTVSDLGSIQVSGDVPALPWVRSRVWVGAELGLGLREGWVDTSPESLIGMRTMAPAKTGETHCGGNTVPYAMLPVRFAKRSNVAQRADTRNVPGDLVRNIFWSPGHKICVRHTCCARGKTSTHLGSTTTSAMLPPQCVLDLPAVTVDQGDE